MRQTISFPLENPPKIRNELRICSLGGEGVIFIVNIIKRMARKLRRIILLHLGFSISFWETPNPFICMIFGYLGVSRTPKPNLIYLRRHQDMANNSRKIPKHFQTYIYIYIYILLFGHHEHSEITCVGKVGKDVCREILKILLIKSWKSWICDQYLPQKHEMAIL